MNQETSIKSRRKERREGQLGFEERNEQSELGVLGK